MSADVVCLRPAADFAEVGVDAPADLRICFASGPADVSAADLATARAVVLASVGPRLERAWLDQATRLQLVQFTGPAWTGRRFLRRPGRTLWWPTCRPRTCGR